MNVTDIGFSPSGKLSSCAYQRALVGRVMYQLQQTAATTPDPQLTQTHLFIDLHRGFENK